MFVCLVKTSWYHVQRKLSGSNRLKYLVQWIREGTHVDATEYRLTLFVEMIDRRLME